MNRKLKNEELNRVSVEEFKELEKVTLTVVLDNIRSFHNVGSVFRTADAFLIEKIVLCGITATPPHREIHKTALGATESVDWKYFENTVDAVKELKEDGYNVYSIEQTENSLKLGEFIPSNKKIAIVFGNEVFGVDQEVINLSNGVIEIPQEGTKHSLNISVSAGIVLWDMYQKMRL